MVITSQSFQGVYTGFSILYDQAYNESPVQYERIVMKVPSATRESTYAWLGQIPNMKEWIGSREAQNIIAHDYTIKNKIYELTIQIPVNDIADDQIGVYSPVVSEMGMSAKKHPDSIVFDLLGHGFQEKCYDKMPFFSEKHPYNKGHDTWSNMGTKKLNAASYAEARCKMMTVMGDNGRPLNIVPDLLVVSPQNEAVARELLFADLIAGSTNVNKATCELLVVPELSAYPEQWYLLCTKRYIKPLIFQEREKPKLVCKNKDTDDNVFFDDQVIYGIKGRYNVGFGLWQLAYGSTGKDSETVESKPENDGEL